MPDLLAENHATSPLAPCNCILPVREGQATSSRIMNSSCTSTTPASPISTTPSQLPNSDALQEAMERRDTMGLQDPQAEVPGL